ncbi:exopolysaccharide biosynthesis polyprenyl glycosylphosphotransferase [bacterium]|nr:exopolysaccharide biosynthesis polyprenyl glycosylphosphotransferase [candidate division CSSED10-310 bacterium]
MTGNPKPAVSIVIPAFNAGKTLPDCLDALTHQSLDASVYEIIIVDDESTDGTPGIAETLSGVMLLEQKHAGPAIARNLGVRHARGDIILFTDADCMASIDFVEEMIKPFADPHVVGVKGAYRTRQNRLWARFAQVEFEERYAKLTRAQSIDFVDSHAAAFRKSIFEEVGGFDPHFPVANNEDVELSYKIARLGYRMVFNSDAIVYHLHPDCMTRYLRTKFLRAYWRMLVYRRFPEKVLSDTYTPQTMKLQILLIVLILAALLGGLIYTPIIRSVPFLAAGFLLSVLPFLYRVFRSDPKIALFSIFALVMRSLIFGVGAGAGFLAQRRQDLLFPTILIVMDMISAFGAYLTAYWIRAGLFAPLMRQFDHTLAIYLSIFPMVMLFWLIAFQAIGLYQTSKYTSSTDEFARVIRAVTLSVFGIITVSYFLKWDFSRALIIFYWFFAVIYANLFRQVVRSIQSASRKKGYHLRRAIVVGTGDLGKVLVRSLQDAPGAGIRIVGVVNDREPDPEDPDWHDIPYLGPVDRLDDIIRLASADDVFIARPDLPNQEILDLIVKCEKTGVGFSILSDLASIVTGSADLYPIARLPIVNLKEEHRDWSRRALKRLTDIAGGLLLIISTLPLFAVLILLVHLRIPGSVFIEEERVGRNGRLFKMLRFRVHPHGYLENSDEPAGFIGRFLRHTSLEDLPQLINVIRGEMSLVGPRPEVPEIVATYAPWQRKRLDVRPGITGLWQVSAAGNRPLHEDLEYDFYYIKNYTIWMDLGLIIRTIPIVIFGRGHGIS